MIIFDLDGTLADCEHRRHFVDPKKNHDFLPIYAKPFDYMNPKTGEIFKPDWKAFYEACDNDTPIQPMCEVFLAMNYEPYKRDVQIWSRRCESVREKTIKWLQDNIPELEGSDYINRILKMRPIGDNTPDEQLKERWLDEHIVSGGSPIQMVFDDRPKVVRMWRRRGVFVFDCNQTGEEF